MTIISCSDTSRDEVTLSTQKVGDKTNTNQQEMASLRKDNNSKVAQQVKPELNNDASSYTESTKNEDLEVNPGDEPPLIFTPSENIDTFAQEQDTGIPLDPDSEDNVYLMSPHQMVLMHM